MITFKQYLIEDNQSTLADGFSLVQNNGATTKLIRDVSKIIGIEVGEGGSIAVKAALWTLMQRGKRFYHYDDLENDFKHAYQMFDGLADETNPHLKAKLQLAYSMVLKTGMKVL